MGSSEPAWRLHALVIDSVDTGATARFWSELLGLAETHRVDQYVFLEDIVPGTRLTIQHVENTTAEKSPIHFDIEPRNFEGFVSHAEALGATRVDAVHNEVYDLLVMTDPSGNEFCVNQRTSDSIRTATGEGR